MSVAAASFLPLPPSGPNTGSAVLTDAIAGDSTKNPVGAVPLPSTPLLPAAPAAAAAAAAAATTSALTVAPASMCGGGGGNGFTEVIATPPTVSSSSLLESTSKSPDAWPSPS